VDSHFFHVPYIAGTTYMSKHFLLAHICSPRFSFKAYSFRSEDLIIPENMGQDFGFTGVLGKQAHSKLRNCFSSASVESKD